MFGLTAALELRRRGHEVDLFEFGDVPRPEAASTDISKLVRGEYGADESYTALMERAFEGWRQWNEGFAEPVFHETGVLFLKPGGIGPGSYEQDSLEVLARRGQPVERLDADALAARFPGWRVPDGDGFVSLRAGWVESGRVLTYLLESARALGVKVHPNLPYVGLVRDGRRVTGILNGRGETPKADWVVLAMGAWTVSTLSHLEDVLWPVANPVFHFRPADPDAYRAPRFLPFAYDVSRTGFYGFCANADGIVKIAHHGPGLRASPDGPREVPAGWEARFRTFLKDALPDLATAPVVHSHLCWYSDTFDGHFWIDRDPEREGLVVATGGSGHAFKFAPVLGELIANAVEGVDDPALAPFRWRARGTVGTEAARSDDP